MSSALLIDPVYQQHQTGRDHPERPERIAALHDAFEQAGLLEALRRVPVRTATEDELALCHTREYIAAARQDIAERTASVAHRRHGDLDRILERGARRGGRSSE